MITRAGVVAVATGVVLTVAGCAHRTTQGATTYRTVTVAPSAASSVPLSPVAAGSSSAASVPVVAMRDLPGSCDSLLSAGTVVDALGHPVAGDTAFVVGTADATTHRVSYVNCRYGITHATPDGTIEIGVSLYRTATAAASRISATISDYTTHAATAARTTVAGLPATMLTGGQGVGYADTVVLAAGQRTIAVTTARAAASELATLAGLAVRRTSGT